MTNELIGVIGIGAFVALMLIGLPIPFSALLIGFFGTIILVGQTAAIQVVTSTLTNQFAQYSLAVGGMFGLMGYLASYTGLGSQLFDIMNKFVGHLRGGLAMATQVACAGFGAICGSPPATIGAFSGIAYPEMKARKYAPGFAGATIAAGAQISTLIPPSGPFILFCLATDVSVGRQFISGVIPGIILTILNIAALAIYLKFFKPSDAPPALKASWKERVKALKTPGLYQILFVFGLSMGGLFIGLFTPSEAGAVGAFGMFLVTLITKSIDIKKFFKAARAAVQMQAMVVTLIGCTAIFSKFINLSGVPAAVGRFCKSLMADGMAPTNMLLLIVLLFFILGMLMDLISVMLMTIPIFYPLVTQTLGFEPVWYGCMITALICLGGLTPPMGASIFMMRNACKDPDMSLGSAFKASVPYFFSFLILCVLMIYVPKIATWLPGLMYS